MRKSDLFFNVLRLPVDLAMLMSAGLTTYFLRTEILSAFRPVLFEFNLPFIRYFYLSIFVSVLFSGIYALSGLYSMKVRIRMLEEFTRILIASSAGILVVIIYIFLRQEIFDSRFLVLGGWFFSIIFVCIGRLLIRYLQAVAVVKYGFGAHRLVIVGDNDVAVSLASKINEDASLGYSAVKKLESAEVEKIIQSIEKHKADEVLLTNNNHSSEFLAELMSYCQEKHIVFKLIPTGSQFLSTNFEVDIFNGLPVIEIKRTNLEGWGRVIKRSLDIVGSVVGFIIILPLFGILAFLIKWETEGPVFVRLKRVSGNKEFYLLKFRSMIENAEELKPMLASYNERAGSPLFKMRNDPRITGVGRFMRKTRFDELPQILNVVKGDISLVGPRPHQPDEIALYQRHHKKVLAIKGGVTGLAQVSGSSDLDFEKEVALDSFYIDNWSLWLDVKVLVRTMLKMVNDRSAV